MPEVRESIIDEYATRLAAISTGSGDNFTVQTVERSLRDPSEVGSSERPYVAIVPGRETWQDTSGGLVTVLWQVLLPCYLTPSAATSSSVVAALSDFTKDVRKALYTAPANLGVSGVIRTRLVGRQGVEGMAEAADRKDATMVIETEVKFQEDADG